MQIKSIIVPVRRLPLLVKKKGATKDMIGENLQPKF